MAPHDRQTTTMNHALGVPRPLILDHNPAVFDPDAKVAGSDANRGTVLLVDDDASVRRAMTRVLRAAGLAVSGFPSAAALLGADLPDQGPRCLLLDLKMPGGSGLELQEALAERGLHLPIVFISGHASFESGVRALKGGALDFLKKPVSEALLLAAVERALALDLIQRAERLDHATLLARLHELTPREREVFTLVASGLANKVVAADLGAAEATIKIHRARVMTKMRATSVADLVRMADKVGLRNEVPIEPELTPKR